jgi:hypothetical protein
VNPEGLYACAESDSSPVYEDFGTYWEHDENNDLSIDNVTINFDTLRRDANAFVYKEIGIGSIGDFVYNFTVTITDVEAGNDYGRDTVSPFIVSNLNLSIGSMSDLGAVSSHDFLSVSLRQEGAVDDYFRWRLYQKTDGVLTFDIIEALGTNNPLDTYYCTVLRSGSRASFLFYNDSTRTILDGNLTSGSADSTAYRYVGLTNIDRSVDGADHVSGLLTNMTRIYPHASINEFEELLAKYNVLIQQYQELNSSYYDLQREYLELEVMFSNIVIEYEVLFDNNTETQDLFRQLLADFKRLETENKALELVIEELELKVESLERSRILGFAIAVIMMGIVVGVLYRNRITTLR